MKNMFTATAVAALLAACASTPAPDPIPPAPAVDAAASCFSAVTQLPKWDEPEAGVDRAWAVVRYELDGSGTASAVRIGSSSGSTRFDTSVVRSYATAKFQPGVKRSGCTELTSFERGRKQ
jgi:TonB family protein